MVKMYKNLLESVLFSEYTRRGGILFRGKYNSHSTEYTNLENKIFGGKQK